MIHPRSASTRSQNSGFGSWFNPESPLKFLTAALLASILSGCATPPPPVSARMVSFASAGSTQPDLEAGRQIFVGACAKCHSLDAPTAFTPKEWIRIVAEMAEPAKISDKQQGVLLSYLLAARSEMLAHKQNP